MAQQIAQATQALNALVATSPPAITPAELQAAISNLKGAQDDLNKQIANTQANSPQSITAGALYSSQVALGSWWTLANSLRASSYPSFVDAAPMVLSVAASQAAIVGSLATQTG